MDLGALLSDSGLKFQKLTGGVILRSVLTLLVGLVVIRILLTLFDRACARSEKLSPLKRHVRPAFKFLLFAALLLIVLPMLGIQITSLVALLSVAGLAVSLALQTTLSNIAGGITLLVTQPFSVGDFTVTAFSISHDAADNLDGGVSEHFLQFLEIRILIVVGT